MPLKLVSASSTPEPLFIADHPALDLINTVFQLEGSPVDSWKSDADVLNWLLHVGWLQGEDTVSFRRGALLDTARALRETVRTLVAQRKAGDELDLSALNAFLAHARRHVELVANEEGELQAVPRYERKTPEQLLAPLAESAAELLMAGDFNLVRVCESPDCILWFYDRTKSHRRRWCSMAVCGNRHKVATFRQRQVKKRHVRKR